MTQDEIMEMARQAHFDSTTWVDIFADNPTVGDVRNYLVAFANLVAAKEREALAQPERDYERGFINGMQKQMQSSVDKAVNAMTQPEQETVIDKSAAIRIATSLGWSPQRTWVGLTDDEMHECAGEFPWTPTGLKCCRAIEAKLKELNT
jgi:hypothetical protein